MDQSVRCEVHHSLASEAGIGSVWLVGIAVVAVQGPHPHPGDPPDWYFPHWYPLTLLGLGTLLALTAGVALLRSRYAVRQLVFTKEQVRCERRAGDRILPIGEVRVVSVEHSGDTERGYNETTLSLQLTWERDGASGRGRYRGRRTERFSCDHDPRLHQALAGLLPSHIAVTEDWRELDEPDPS